MKLEVQRIGSSLGVLVPETELARWGVGEGDFLLLGERSIRPPHRGGLSQTKLHDLNREIALAVVRAFTPTEIREKILANLQRWEAQGAWTTAYDEWRTIALSGDDGLLFVAMLGLDEDSIRLRSSMPFVGMLPRNEVRTLHEEAST